MRRCLLSIVSIVALLAGCSRETDYYVVGNSQQRRESRALLAQLDETSRLGGNRVAIVEQIAGQLLAAGYPQRLRIFLTTHVETHPDDPYNTYYLFLVARSWGNEAPALYYYRRLLWRHADVLVRGESVHWMTLTRLLELDDDPSLRVSYYDDLIKRFSDRLDLASTYYQMAETYRRIGEWNIAYQSYRRFLEICLPRPDHCNEEIPGQSDAYRSIQAQVRFYDSDKDWTMENLDELVALIKEALRSRNATSLLRYRAGENFFSRSWEQEEFDFNSQISYNLGIFMVRSRVHFADDIDINSNAREAYLRTWGWSHRIGTWYLYFRRVDFPSDPEIHGNWEWAGIFFGERL